MSESRSDPQIWLPTDAGFDDAVASTVSPANEQVRNKELLSWGIAIAIAGFVIGLLGMSTLLAILAMLVGFFCMVPGIQEGFAKEGLKKEAREARNHTLPLLEKPPSETKRIDESGKWSITKQVTFTDIEHMKVTNGTGRHRGSAIINVRWRGRDDFPPVLYLIKDGGRSIETDVNALRHRSTAVVIAVKRHGEPIENLEDATVEDGKTYYYYALVTIPIYGEQLLIRRRVITHVARRSESLADLKDLDDLATTAELEQELKRRLEKVLNADKPPPSFKEQVADAVVKEKRFVEEVTDAHNAKEEIINSLTDDEDLRERLHVRGDSEIARLMKERQKKKPH